MGLASVRIASAERRDRLLLVSAVATTLLTLLGAAGEAVGLDRRAALPKMKADQFEALATRFGELVAEHRVFKEIFGVIWGDDSALAEHRADLCGVTIHVVDRGIDTGPALAQVKIAPDPSDCFVTYPYLQLEAGRPALILCARAALEGTLAPAPAWTSTSKLHFHPTLGEYLRNRLGFGVR